MENAYKTDIILFSIFLSWILPAFILFGWDCFVFFVMFFTLYGFVIACSQPKEYVFIGSLSSAFLTACILISVLYAIFYSIADDPKSIVVEEYMEKTKEFISLFIKAALPVSLALFFFFCEKHITKTNR